MQVIYISLGPKVDDCDVLMAPVDPILVPEEDNHEMATMVGIQPVYYGMSPYLQIVDSLKQYRDDMRSQVESIVKRMEMVLNDGMF